MAVDPRERLMRRVRYTPYGCWEWDGKLERNGYAKVTIDGRTDWAHRRSYEAFVGPIPAGRDVDHLCRNRPCIHPDHLEPVTRQENLLRGAGPELTRERSCRTLCVHGHAMTPDNIYLYRRAGRTCRACRICKHAASQRESARRKARRHVRHGRSEMDL